MGLRESKEKTAMIKKKGIRNYGTISWGYLEIQGKDCGSNSEKKIKKSLEGFEQMSIKI